MPQPKIVNVKLDKPLKRGETEIAELALREPDAGALRGLSLIDVVRMDAGAILTLLPRIATPPLTDPELEQLGAADLLAIAAEVSDFFMSSADRKGFRPA